MSDLRRSVTIHASRKEIRKELIALHAAGCRQGGLFVRLPPCVAVEFWLPPELVGAFPRHAQRIKHLRAKATLPATDRPAGHSRHSRF